MQPVSDDEAVAADIFLSIVPPDQAAPLAARMAARCKAIGKAPIYIDLNAVSPETAAEVARILAPSGASFVDGGIIGAPPKGNAPGPTFYVSGPVGDSVEISNRYGLVTRASQAGLARRQPSRWPMPGSRKGIISRRRQHDSRGRTGGRRACFAGRARRQPGGRAGALEQGNPRLLPKAYRWVPEMREIESSHRHGLAGEPHLPRDGGVLREDRKRCRRRKGACRQADRLLCVLARLFASFRRIVAKSFDRDGKCL